MPKLLDKKTILKKIQQIKNLQQQISVLNIKLKETKSLLSEEKETNDLEQNLNNI